jgi:hypothetical protein
MGRVYDDISEEQARWIGEQPMFFVATAAPDAHVNVSYQVRLNSFGCHAACGHQW